MVYTACESVIAEVRLNKQFSGIHGISRWSPSLKGWFCNYARRERAAEPEGVVNPFLSYLTRAAAGRCEHLYIVCGCAPSRSASPIDRLAAATIERSALPSAAGGVPTQMNERSASATGP